MRFPKILSTFNQEFQKLITFLGHKNRKDIGIPPTCNCSWYKKWEFNSFTVFDLKTKGEEKKKENSHFLETTF